MALHVAAIIDSTLNVLSIEAPCVALFLGNLVLNLHLLSSSLVGLHTLFMSSHISKHLCWMGRRLQAMLIFLSLHNSRQSNGIEPFGGLFKSTLGNFLRSDCNYLQLPRLLSQF